MANYKLLKIKISCAGWPSTSIKSNSGLTSISKFLPKNGNIWENCKFFINEQVQDPDYWFIIDNIDSPEEACLIEKNKVFFLSAELPFVTSYFDEEKFLSQFYGIFSPHAIYNHKNNTASLPFLPFMINTTHGSSVFDIDHNYNYENILKDNKPNKTKTLSIIASSKGSNSNKLTDFHKVRYNFALKLKEHFGDKVDLFGYGHNEIKTKVDAILPYKYHICLENQSTNNVVTEKLYDSFLGLSYPIYWGAPNINDYFSKNSLTEINIFDFKGTVNKIEKVIEEDLFEKNFEYLIKSKNDVLNKFGIFPRINKICKTIKDIESFDKKNITILNRNSFIPNLKKQKKKQKLKKIFQYGGSSIIIYELIKHLIKTL